MALATGLGATALMCITILAVRYISNRPPEPCRYQVEGCGAATEHGTAICQGCSEDRA